MKKSNIVYCIITFFLFSFYSCKKTPTTSADEYNLVDKKATESVKSLYKRIINISKKGIAVGHQDDTSYGLGWNHKDAPSTIKSDVQKVTGDFPAVFGFDLGWIEIDKAYNLDTVPFNSMKNLIIDAHKRGGIITFSWHLDNPVSGGSSWDKTAAVSSIIKGGNQREKYELWVSKLANFIKTLEFKGTTIPVVFRPYHEMNGSWFWWGGENCKPKDYITLWQETVVLLRDTHNVHNLLYAYSPNKLNPEDEYLTYYPGDDFVDMLGIDIYDFNNSEEYMKAIVHDLAIVKKVATEKNKPYAFTETGLESLQTENWFTKVLYPSIKNTGIAWVLTWRNYDTKHHYMPYKGQLNEADFIEFEKLPETLFLKDITN